MKIVGLTGGIGSGKSTVADFFSELGIPVYKADDEAKALMNRSKVIRRKLTALFGKKAYKKDELNRPFIADKIFNDPQLLAQMNAVVHPKVRSHFKRWLKKQNAEYVIKEVAILFETGGDLDCDLVITVTAPLEIRLERLLKRDKTTSRKIKAIMKNQWDDAERMKGSHYVIENLDLENTKKEVARIHQKITSKK